MFVPMYGELAAFFIVEGIETEMMTRTQTDAAFAEDFESRLLRVELASRPFNGRKAAKDLPMLLAEFRRFWKGAGRKPRKRAK